MDRLTLVRQQHPSGCAVAAYATIAGLTWEEAVEETRFSGEAFKPGRLIRCLQDRGFYTRSVLSATLTGGTWPPPPFALLHFADVQPPGRGHSHIVVMEADGTVLDPFDGKRKGLSSWEVVHEVCGLQAAAPATEAAAVKRFIERLRRGLIENQQELLRSGGDPDNPHFWIRLDRLEAQIAALDQGSNDG
jgi:hypothetical protein